MQPFRLIGLAVLMLAAAGCVAPDPFAQNRRLGRGVNLGNALDAPAEGAWGVTLQPEYFRRIREARFDSVRIPIRWSAHAAPTPPYTIDPAFFARVDWAVACALSNQLAVVINVHHDTELMDDPEAHRDRFLALWKQIAEHYRQEPAPVLFELLNEPQGALTPELWNELLLQALGVVRGIDPERTVIVDAARWAGLDALESLRLPEGDRNLIASVHCYIPFEFTHQGAEWMAGSDKWMGRSWTGSEAERSELRKAFGDAAAWAATHHRPIYLGEFGAYRKCDMESRARWTAFVARLAEQEGLSWAYWEFCSGFGVFDPAEKAWRAPLLDALIPAGGRP